MYESPISLIQKVTYDTTKQINKAVDEEIYRAVLKVGVNVDREELIKALQYDRNQYVKGYNDKNAEIVRCKDCRHFTHYADGCGVCNEKDHILTYQNQNDFCSYGERAEQTDKYPWEAIPCDDPERQERINNYKEYHMPGHDEVMDALDNLKVKFIVKGKERVKRIKEGENE